MHIYFFFGPVSVGGCVSPYFLETAAAIQKAVQVAECSNREDLRKRNDKELVEKAQTKKGRRLLANTIDEVEECDPTTSFGEAYGKQLELEAVRVETERSREQREHTQYVMTMLECVKMQFHIHREEPETAMLTVDSRVFDVFAPKVMCVIKNVERSLKKQRFSKGHKGP